MSWEICKYLSKNRLNYELSESSELKTLWDNSLTTKNSSKNLNKIDLIPSLLRKYFQILDSDEKNEDNLLYIERLVSLFTFLLSQV